MRIKAKIKGLSLIVKARASFGENLDEESLGMLARTNTRLFLKPRVLHRNVVEYSGPVGICLRDRLRNPITQLDFLYIMEYIVVGVRKLQQERFMLNHFLTDLRYIYMNDTTKEVQFLYIPREPKAMQPDIRSLMERVIYSAKPASQRDAETILKFSTFLKSEKDFSLERVEACISRLDRSVVNAILKQNPIESGFITNKRAVQLEREQNKKNGWNEGTALLQEDEDATGLLNENYQDDGFEDTGLLDLGGMGDDGYQNTSYQDNGYDDMATGLLTEDSDEGTTLLQQDRAAEVHYPSLHRVITGETISVNKPVFRLGKERSYVDYFVTNNSAVSRSHADIIVRGNSCFVMDLNSKNHTYINNQMIPVHTEVEIHYGDHLKLANEEFIFYS